jgi:riboflavin kinase / FMN adenylyltransferase
VDPPFTYSGIVVPGNHLGRSIGFPTINIVPDKDHPLPIKYGVYAVKVRWNDRLYNGMAYFGIRPTLDGETLILEVNIFNFSEELYGELVTILFLDFVREEKKFATMEELRLAIEDDCNVIRKLLSTGF